MPLVLKADSSFPNCNRGDSRPFEAQRGLPEATPPTRNILAQAQSEADGDLKLYNTIVGVPAGLNLKKLGTLWCRARVLGQLAQGDGLEAGLESSRLWKLQQNKTFARMSETSLKADLETRLQGREAMEIWNKTLRGRLRGRPGAMEIGANQYISQRRGPFLVLKRQEKADAGLPSI